MPYSFSDNSDAQYALKFINRTSQHLFLTGKAGSGKTTLLKQIIASTHKNIVVAAPTGVAAINAGGVTLHSLLHLPFGAYCPDDSQQSFGSTQVTTPSTIRQGLKFRKEKRNMLKKMDILVIDEASMLRADMLDAIDATLRFVRGIGSNFGGVQILFIGDLFQLPPVVKREEEHMLSTYYQSPYFFNAHALRDSMPLYIELKKVYRQEEQNFIDVLNRVRNNKFSEVDIDYLNERYQPDFDIIKNKSYIFLSTHNKAVDETNQTALKKLKGKTHRFRASIEGEFKETMYPIEEVLELKLGAQVMFIKNDTSEARAFFNGKIGQIASLDDGEIYVEFTDGSPSVQVQRDKWTNVEYKLNEETKEIEEKELGSFVHYPLRLAWAITIHKSQGLTLDKAVVDVSKVFAPGQLYVALSRLSSFEGLVLNSKINLTVPPINQKVIEFSESEKDSQSLEKDLQAASQQYAKQCLLTAFDFSDIRNSLMNHLHSYSKETARSTKARYKDWFSSYVTDFHQLHGVADKFCQQVEYLLYHNKVEELKQRLQDGKAYFNQELQRRMQSLETKFKLIQKQKTVKSYLLELKEVEHIFLSQLATIEQHIKLFDALYSGKEIAKEELKLSPEMQQKLKEAGEIKKVPTHQVSYDFYLEGYDIEKIAKTRNLGTSTIVTHLSKYVELGKIEAVDLIGEDKTAAITAAIVKLSAKHSTLNMTIVKEAMDTEVDYNDIKIVLAQCKHAQKTK